ncbi:MAG TPA: 4Fe-4S ferredoxin [Anaeromyxobacteraceae bacterium]|nr:4Fe-4S ferredoxin [Anaeromyxobacteraceae bacterium]
MLRSPILLAAVAFVTVSVGLQVAQAPWKEQFPGSYPRVLPPSEGRFEFLPDEIRIHLSEETKSGRIIVFAHTSDGSLLGLLKPIESGVVTVRRGDLDDYRLATRGAEVGEHRLLKALDRYVEREDMMERITEARAKGLRFGLQRCLYPICNRCLDGCKSVMRADFPIRMRVGERGNVEPAFAKGKCPRCGKCFIWCPSGVIRDGGSLTN